MRLGVSALLGFLALAPHPAAAQPPLCPPVALPSNVSLAATSPFSRQVTLRAREISLREALDRLAVVARVRLIYAVETLPLDRSVCVSFDSVSMWQALATVLSGLAVEPLAAGPDQIVLAPVRFIPQPMLPFTLDRIVVTGSANGAAQKPLSLALTIVEGRRLAAASGGNLSEAVNAAVPGLWMWRPSPTSFVSQYGSVRGASSFGLSYPKLFIDGIEVANPLLVGHIDPEMVDRIEAIRGPQGAALYGADAISGVTNIVMRHDGADESRAVMRTGVRRAESRWASSPPLEQEHALALRAGSGTGSAAASVEVGINGAFIPDAFARHLGVTGTARMVGSRTIVTGTVRFYNAHAVTAPNPLLPASLLADAARKTTGLTSPETVEQHTAGMSFKFQQSEHLTHSLLAGFDGYALDGVPNERLPVPSATDAALVAARGGANRGTFRLSSTGRFAPRRALSGDVTLLAEHSPLHEWTTAVSGTQTGTSAVPLLAWRSNSGIGGQINTTLFRQLFLTGGLRVERATNVQGLSRLPMLGAAWVPAQGVVTIKFRGAYGKGIRWPQTTVRETLGEGVRPGIDTVSSLLPEKQSGVEGGVEIVVGRTLTLGVTRFDQTASGLIQRVGVLNDTVLASGEVKHRIIYQPQNVGRIVNRGWELQGSIGSGPLSLAGTLSLVDSRVRNVARTYSGDLRAGDRMLAVPRRTMSGTVAWLAAHWSSTVTAYRAEDWVYYDRLLVAQRYVAGDRSFAGGALRKYWISYPGVTHLRATFARDLRFGFSLLLTGDNLLNHQTGEPDNVAVLPGRTIAVGLRGEF
ncbi:MAG: TonB-dependent receptor [Gemmatimonadetes bacterium]|nr:TonB-dependent receptor [Gemmatimonadota bacterium]